MWCAEKMTARAGDEREAEGVKEQRRTGPLEIHPSILLGMDGAKAAAAAGPAALGICWLTQLNHAGARLRGQQQATAAPRR
jgi:hypothetical protein